MSKSYWGRIIAVRHNRWAVTRSQLSIWTFGSQKNIRTVSWGRHPPTRRALLRLLEKNTIVHETEHSSAVLWLDKRYHQQYCDWTNARRIGIKSKSHAWFYALCWNKVIRNHTSQPVSNVDPFTSQWVIKNGAQRSVFTRLNTSAKFTLLFLKEGNKSCKDNLLILQRRNGWQTATVIFSALIVSQASLKSGKENHRGSPHKWETSYGVAKNRTRSSNYPKNFFTAGTSSYRSQTIDHTAGIIFIATSTFLMRY